MVVEVEVPRTGQGPVVVILVMVVGRVGMVDMPRILTELVEEEEPVDMAAVLLLVDLAVMEDQDLRLEALLVQVVVEEVVEVVAPYVMVEEVVELAF